MRSNGFRAVPDGGNIGVRRVGRAVAGVGVHPNTDHVSDAVLLKLSFLT